MYNIKPAAQINRRTGIIWAASIKFYFGTSSTYFIDNMLPHMYYLSVSSDCIFAPAAQIYTKIG
jgi:hypothetical protein